MSAHRIHLKCIRQHLISTSFLFNSHSFNSKSRISRDLGCHHNLLNDKQPTHATTLYRCKTMKVILFIFLNIFKFLPAMRIMLENADGADSQKCIYEQKHMACICQIHLVSYVRLSFSASYNMYSLIN